MINYPIIYHRNYQNDFPSENRQSGEGLSLRDKSQKVALALLPLLSIHRPFRGPLSLGLSGLRSVTYIHQMIEDFKQGNIREGSFHLLHASLAVSAVVLFFFNPVLSFLSSSVSDVIINFRNFVENGKEGHYREMAEALAFMVLDLLFISSFCYGAIEITVACMILQIILDFYVSAEHFKKGDYLEGACQAILAGVHMHQAIPQLKVLRWKWTHDPVLTAELKQDKRGFVYLDIPDENLNSLLELCGDNRAELPPYFGKGRAGAHVSVILSQEMLGRNGLKIEDIGKKFTFRIVNMDAVKPDGWKGVGKVHFLTLSCPQLESMRVRYGFSPKIDNHDFHLTFGIQKDQPATPFNWLRNMTRNAPQFSN